jgi:hypothetical protein
VGLAGISRRFSSDTVDALRALAQRRQRDVDGHVATADDDHARPDARGLAAAHRAQEVDAAEHEGMVRPRSAEARRLRAGPTKTAS